jgi:hypothetical protein
MASRLRAGVYLTHGQVRLEGLTARWLLRQFVIVLSSLGRTSAQKGVAISWHRCAVLLGVPRYPCVCSNTCCSICSL